MKKILLKTFSTAVILLALLVGLRILYGYTSAYTLWSTIMPTPGATVPLQYGLTTTGTIQANVLTSTTTLSAGGGACSVDSIGNLNCSTLRGNSITTSGSGTFGSVSSTGGIFTPSYFEANTSHSTAPGDISAGGNIWANGAGTFGSVSSTGSGTFGSASIGGHTPWTAGNCSSSIGTCTLIANASSGSAQYACSSGYTQSGVAGWAIFAGSACGGAYVTGDVIIQMVDQGAVVMQNNSGGEIAVQAIGLCCPN